MVYSNSRVWSHLELNTLIQKLSLNFTAMWTTSCTYEIVVGLIQNQLFHVWLILIGGKEVWSEGGIVRDTDIFMTFITLESPSPPKLTTAIGSVLGNTGTKCQITYSLPMMENWWARKVKKSCRKSRKLCLLINSDTIPTYVCIH